MNRISKRRRRVKKGPRHKHRYIGKASRPARDFIKDLLGAGLSLNTIIDRLGCDREQFKSLITAPAGELTNDDSSLFRSLVGLWAKESQAKGEKNVNRVE